MVTLGTLVLPTAGTIIHDHRAHKQIFATTPTPPLAHDRYMAENKSKKVLAQNKSENFRLSRLMPRSAPHIGDLRLAHRLHFSKRSCALPLLRKLAHREQQCRRPKYPNVPLELGGEDGRLCGKLAVDGVLRYRLAYLVEKRLAN
jgi:hypothetical protein